MAYILILGIFLTFITICICNYQQYPSLDFCQLPPADRTIPLRLAQFPRTSVIYSHAMVNAKRMVYVTKCIKGTYVRSPYSEVRAAGRISQQNLRSGAVMYSTELVEEHCPGVWELREKDNGRNFNIHYKLWGDGQSIIALVRMYKDRAFFDDVFVLFSTRRYLTREDIVRAYAYAKIKIHTLHIISHENCRDY